MIIEIMSTYVYINANGINSEQKQSRSYGLVYTLCSNRTVVIHKTVCNRSPLCRLVD